MTFSNEPNSEAVFGKKKKEKGTQPNAICLHNSRNMFRFLLKVTIMMSSILHFDIWNRFIYIRILVLNLHYFTVNIVLLLHIYYICAPSEYFENFASRNTIL